MSLVIAITALALQPLYRLSSQDSERNTQHLLSHKLSRMPAALMKTQRIKKLKQPFVGQLIRELRQVSGLAQEELATSLGVSFSTISRWERAKANSSPVASSLIETKLTELGKRGEALRFAKPAATPIAVFV